MPTTSTMRMTQHSVVSAGPHLVSADMTLMMTVAVLVVVIVTVGVIVMMSLVALTVVQDVMALAAHLVAAV